MIEETAIPYAECLEDQCPLNEDCVMVKGHGGLCYLTEWLFDARERERWRAARKKPKVKLDSIKLDSFDWSRYTGARK